MPPIWNAWHVPFLEEVSFPSFHFPLGSLMFLEVHPTPPYLEKNRRGPHLLSCPTPFKAASSFSFCMILEDRSVLRSSEALDHREGLGSAFERSLTLEF
jgi:hypothetical protein